MPRGLHDAFGETVERIMRQPKGLSDQAMNVFKWVFLAERPLVMEELRHALAVKQGDTDLDRDNIASEKSLLNSCHGLIIIDEGTSTVRLVHLSLQEYLLTQCDTLFPQGHCEIARTCLTYLNFSSLPRRHQRSQAVDFDFEKSRAEESEFYEQSAKFCFVYYAACQWGHHARKQTDDSVITLAMHLLHPNADLRCCSWILFRSMQHCDWRKDTRFSGLHIAAYFGVDRIVRSLAEISKVNAMDSWDYTPLFYAAMKGHETVVRLLVARDDVDANLSDHFGTTPLLLAAREGHYAVVRLLLERDDIDPNSTVYRGLTPLRWAVINGHYEVVRRILERDDVDMNSRD